MRWLKRIWLKSQTGLGALFFAMLASLFVYQLCNTWAFGRVLSILLPRDWITFDAAPRTYVASLIFHSLAALLMSVWTVLAFMSWRAERRMWVRRESQTKRDDVIRQSPEER